MLVKRDMVFNYKLQKIFPVFIVYEIDMTGCKTYMLINYFLCIYYFWKFFYWIKHFLYFFTEAAGSDEEDFFDALPYHAEEFKVALPHEM